MVTIIKNPLQYTKEIQEYIDSAASLETTDPKTYYGLKDQREMAETLVLANSKRIKAEELIANFRETVESYDDDAMDHFIHKLTESLKLDRIATLYAFESNN